MSGTVTSEVSKITMNDVMFSWQRIVMHTFHLIGLDGSSVTSRDQSRERVGRVFCH